MATAVLFFATLNVVKFPTYLYAGILNCARLSRLLWVLPLLPVGVWAGKLLSARIRREPFEKLVLALLVLISGFLLFT